MEAKDSKDTSQCQLTLLLSLENEGEVCVQESEIMARLHSV